MKKILFLFVFIIYCLGVFSQNKSYKRGISYGYHSAQDMQKASTNISWWYNWAAQPDAAIRNNYQSFNVDYTPMAWNTTAIGGVNYWANRDSTIKYILGFNEPNFKDQANMTPTQAANAWPYLQSIAQKHELKIVGPAVNYCGNCVSEGGITYTNPFKYLDDFFAACDTCQVDFVGLHWYGSGSSITGYINDARKYGKPIWVTEFASWDNNNPVPDKGEQKKYLAGAVNFLERDPDIYRYSWFIGRTEGGINSFPYIDLYGENGMLTELGQLYMDIPVYDPEMRFSVPGRIECEEYFLMSGLYAEPTTDIDGFLNLGWTDPGDWAEYKIEVAKNGVYSISARIAGTNTGKLDILVNNVRLKTLDTPNTGGWQNWRDVESEIELEEGEHILKLRIRDAGFNINWLKFSGTTTVENQYERLKTLVYPNPVSNGILNIKLQRNQSGGEYSFSLTDIHGKQVFSKKEKPFHSLIQLNINENQILPKGIYYLHISGENSGANRLIVVQ